MRILNSFRRVVLGISGGVDSAVAATLLKSKGYEVFGVFMRNWDLKDEKGNCSVDSDAEDAEWVCKKLQIPFSEVNFVKEYWIEVFSYLLEEYQRGFTPNPDIFCNKHIKFNYFLKHAQENFDASAISSGHYAQNSFGSYLEHFNANIDAKLLIPVDIFKDQTFFLSQIPQKALRHTMFPLGGLLKSEVRKIAEKEGLSRVDQKRDSTGICFIGKRKNFKNFLKEYIDETPGDLIDLETGEIIGEHHGIHNWTIGQRCELLEKVPSKCYVSSKDVYTNTIFIVKNTNHPSLYSDTLYVEPLNWIAKPFPDKQPFRCKFRFQHRYPLVDCTYIPNSSGGFCKIVLDTPLRALTQGQFSVLYKDGECLGSSKMMSIGPSIYEKSLPSNQINEVF